MRLLKQLKSSYNKRNGLPRGFTEVEYLESSGTQYINTGYVPNNNTTIKFNIQLTSTSIDWAIITGRRSIIGTNTFFYMQFTNSQDFSNSALWFVFGSQGNTTALAYPNPLNKHVITISVPEQKIIVDGNTTSFSGSIQSGNNYPLNVFASINASGSLSTGQSLKLYYYKIWDNGVLIRDFIPALDTNNVPCMYDRVTKTAYYNAGTGEFGIGRKIYGIEYLETTGTQYIDTGIKGKSGISANTKINYTYLPTTSSTSAGIGGEYKDNNSCYFGMVRTNGHFTYHYKGTPVETNTTLYTNTDYELDITLNDGNQKYTINGTVVSTGTISGTFDSGINTYLFAINNNGKADVFGSLKMYYMQILENNTLSRDYYPVRDENGIGYMYDAVTHTLFENKGTGSFTLGNDKEQWDNTSKIAFVEEYKGKLPRKYTEVEYLEATGTQYINTGLLSTAQSKVDVVFGFSSMESGVANNVGVFGGRNGTTLNTFTLFKIASATPQYFRFDYNAQPTVGTSDELTWNTDSKYRFQYNGVNCISTNLTTGESVTVVRSPGSTFTEYPICLFAVNSIGTIGQFLSGRIYHYWYTDGTTTIDLIPVLDETGKPCMYDLIEGKPYYNQGTGDDFNYGPKIKLVEYIESSGTQYIDTGYIPTNTTGQYAKMQYTTVNNGVTFGGMVSGNGTVGPYFSSGYWWTRWGTAEPKIEASSPITTNTYELYLNFNNDRVAKANDIIISDSLGNISGNYPSLTLFRRNFSAGYAYLSGKIYKYQITEGTDLVRDFIPVIDENNVGYMFDKVNHVLYKNTGTGSFTYGNSVRSYTLRLFKERDDIPTTYKRVSYLQSTGTQYIDTGYIASDSSGFSVNIMPLQASDNYFIGSRPRTITNDRWLAGSNAGPQVYIGWNTNTYTSWELNKVHTVQNNFMNSRTKVLDGTTVAQISETLSSQGSRTAYLFSANDASATSRDTCRIYGAQISNENTLVRDFVPVIRKSDNKPGMWDKVTRTFYTNAGSGEFNYGE